jgi:uncharacterized protein (TIGR03083 family)
MEEAEIRTATVAQRERLADTLAALPEERWDDATLCEGWRAREVVAHVTMPFRLSLPQFVGQMVRAGGNFNRMADRRARADADALSAAELTASVRENVGHPWKPPGGGYRGALTHDTIHALDLAVPLDLDWRVPEETLRLVLDGWTAPRAEKIFGVDLAGVELRADDLDWRLGSGQPLSGAGQDLLLVLAGRRLPAGRLHGERSAAFTRIS